MRNHFSIIATLLVTTLCTMRVSAQTYHLTDLGTLGGSTSQAFSINASGVVVGQSLTPTSTIYPHAFLYDGTLHDLGTLGGVFSGAEAINGLGRITGTTFNSGSQQHAFIYDGTMHDITTASFGAGFSAGGGINDSGEIVGSGSVLNGNHAFLWKPATPTSVVGTLYDLGTLGGDYSFASGVNSNGKIAGSSYVTSTPFVEHAFLWTPAVANGTTGSMLDLGTFGGAFSAALSINNSGFVTGYADKIGDNIAHAFLYDTTLHDLGTLGGAYVDSEGLSINAAGQIVGDISTQFGGGIQHAMLYSNGIMKDLNNLLDNSAQGWTLQIAHDINDSGLIVGTGTNSSGDTHAYLLSPVPEPPSLVLAALGFGGWWWIARRKKRQKLPARRRQLQGAMLCRLWSVTTLSAAVLMVGSISSTVQAQSFTRLGVVSGFTSESDANAISGDGSTVVGLCLNSSNNPDGFRWTNSTGMVALPTFSTALGTSANGSVIVGSAFGSKGASRWTQPTGWVSLGHLTGGTASSTAAQGVSGDGNVVIGYSGSTSGNQAFRWTQATGMTGLGDLAGGTFMSSASGISADGATIVGYSDSGTGGEAFRWTQATGMVGLGFLPTNLSYSFSAAYAASADGSVIVGQGTAMDGQDPFRWTQATGMVDLGGGGGLALATSADGSIVVGEGESGAFIWDVVHGMRNLQSVLTNDYGLGNSLSGWYLRRGTGLSADGSAIVGWGINPNGNYEAWIVNVPEPSAFVLAALGAAVLLAARRCC